MKYLLMLVLAAALAGIAWLYHSDSRLVANLPADLMPETAEQASPTPDPAADAHLQTLTREAGDTLDISQADHFVNADQLLQFPDTSADQAQRQQASDGYAIDLGGTPARASGAQNTSEQPVSLPGEGLVRLSELLDQPQTVEPHIYFLHAVDPDDQQGLWGIVQHALTKTFAKGIALTEDLTLKAQIPQDADERNANQTSSFLGSLLNEKVEQTYIYNYRQGILGRNPDLILPGQQLVIVSFTEPELRQVYQHFTQGSHGDSQE